MAHDGDKNDPTAHNGETSAMAPEDEAAAALAAAQAAAEAAAKAAADAAAKAQELAKKAAAAKAPAQVSEPPDLGVDKAREGAPKAPSAAAPRVAPAVAESALEIKPNSEGLFGTDAIDEEAGAAFTPEKAYLTEKRSIAAIVAFAIAIALIIGGVVYIMSDSDSSQRVKWFLAGTACAMDDKTMEPTLPVPPDPPGNLNCLQLYVEKSRRAAEAAWKAEDYRSRHVYGDATLLYFPEDARVDVYQTKYAQEGKAWTRNEAGPGEMICDATHVEIAPEGIITDALKAHKRCERELKNKTAELKENQFLKELPLKNLPVFETDKCTDQEKSWNAAEAVCKVGGTEYKLGAVMAAYTFEYRIKLSREGYEPREFVWRKNDWRRGAPNFSMDWPGVDLIPKPETRMKNYAQAECALYCYQVMKEVAYNEIDKDTLERILNRNGFKDEADFGSARNVLTRGDFTPWWTAKQEAVQKLTKKDCEDESKNICAVVAADMTAAPPGLAPPSGAAPTEAPAEVPTEAPAEAPKDAPAEP